MKSIDNLDSDLSTVRPKTVLVTGATGFLGTHLIESLYRAGWRVLAYSRKPMSDSLSPFVREGDWKTGDYSDLEQLCSACDGVDILFHTAAVQSECINKNELVRVNLGLTKNLYLASKRSKVRRFVFVSSILAADPKVSDYALSKRLAEDYLLGCDDETEVVVLRAATIFGIGMQGSLISFIRLSKYKGFPALPYSGSTFPMISVKDFCHVCLLVSEEEYRSKKVVFSVADGEKYSAARIEEAVYSSIGRQRPRLRVPRLAFFALSLGAQIGRLLGYRKNSLGMQLYRNYFASRTLDDPGMPSTYNFSPSFTLEQEMIEIIRSTDRENVSL